MSRMTADLRMGLAASIGCQCPYSHPLNRLADRKVPFQRRLGGQVKRKAIVGVFNIYFCAYVCVHVRRRDANAVRRDSRAVS